MKREEFVNGYKECEKKEGHQEGRMRERVKGNTTGKKGGLKETGMQLREERIAKRKTEAKRGTHGRRLDRPQFNI